MLNVRMLLLVDLTTSESMGGVWFEASLGYHRTSDTSRLTLPLLGLQDLWNSRGA